jgi:two-component system chemotaxis response regulator CheB
LELDALHRTRLVTPASKQEFRPSVNRLFQSVAQTCGRDAIAVLLTGMGNDGAEGMRTVRERGGLTLAQDESTSVVFGMAHEAVRGGGVDRVLPLQEIVPAILKRLQQIPGGFAP